MCVRERKERKSDPADVRAQRAYPGSGRRWGYGSVEAVIFCLGHDLGMDAVSGSVELLGARLVLGGRHRFLRFPSKGEEIRVATDSSSRSVEETTEVARVQSLFRDVNERIRGLNEEFEPLAAAGEWFCECADPNCFERLEMTQEEYDAIRRHPDRFPVIPGHEVLGAERVMQVVSRHSNYLVVETLDSQADVAGTTRRRAKAGGSA